jgi:hypothetical protein
VKERSKLIKEPHHYQQQASKQQHKKKISITFVLLTQNTINTMVIFAHPDRTVVSHPIAINQTKAATLEVVSPLTSLHAVS